MGKFTEVFNYVRNNNIKAINNSIQDVGRKHHAMYMRDMMFNDDININYQLLSKIQNEINSFYEVVCANFLIKKRAQDILECQDKNIVIPEQNLTTLTDEQLLTLIYQHAMEYYFKIDTSNESNFNSYFIEAIQYRIISNFLQSDMERILIKMQEDIEIIIEDTKNVDFLMSNYKRIDKFDNLYNCILEQLVESIRNVILRDGKFDEEYFDTVKKISTILRKTFVEGK